MSANARPNPRDLLRSHSDRRGLVAALLGGLATTKGASAAVRVGADPTVGLPFYGSRNEVARSVISADTQALLLSNPHGSGTALYRRIDSVAAEAPPWQLRSRDGAAWQLASEAITPDHLGAFGDGLTDDAASFKAADAAAHATGAVLEVRRRHFVRADLCIRSAIRFYPGACIRLAEGCKVRFEAALEHVPGEVVVEATPSHAAALAFEPAVAAVGIRAHVTARELYPHMFGAQGDDRTPNEHAFDLWWAALQAGSLPGYLPPGRYRFERALDLPLQTERFRGVEIAGAGRQETMLNFQSVDNKPLVRISCSGAKPRDNFYLKLRNFGVYGHAAGPVMALGLDDYSDPVNEPVLEDIWIGNGDRSPSAVGLRLNYVLNATIRSVVNCAGSGVALELRQASFSTFSGSFSNAGIGVRMGDGFTSDNVFTALDLENCSDCVVSDDERVSGNTFVGGTWSFSRHGFVDLAGARALVLNPGLNPVPPATPEGFVGGRGTGVRVVGTTPFGLTTPPVPESGVPAANRFGVQVAATVWGGSVSAIAVNGFEYGIREGMFLLSPGDTIHWRGSSPPLWVWRPCP